MERPKVKSIKYEIIPENSFSLLSKKLVSLPSSKPQLSSSKSLLEKNGLFQKICSIESNLWVKIKNSKGLNFCCLISKT